MLFSQHCCSLCCSCLLLGHPMRAFRTPLLPTNSPELSVALPTLRLSCVSGTLNLFLALKHLERVFRDLSENCCKSKSMVDFTLHRVMLVLLKLNPTYMTKILYGWFHRSFVHVWFQIVVFAIHLPFASYDAKSVDFL